MNDDSDDFLGDDPGRTIEVVPTSPDWLRNSEAVKGIVDAAISYLDARRADGGSDSKSAPTPKRSTVGLPLDAESDVARSWRSRELRRRAEEEERRRREEEEREERFVNKEALARAAEAARLRPPAPKYTPKDWRDPQMHGDAAEVTISTRNKIMETALPRVFVLPEKGMLVCSGKADAVLTLGTEDAKLLPTLGKDFGYNPKRKRWISRKRGPKFKT